MSRRQRPKSNANRLRITRLEDRVTPTTIVGLGQTGAQLTFFNTAVLGTSNSVNITGLNAGEEIEAIDFRPATGQLFGVGVAGTTARIGTFNLQTGAFSAIGSSFAVSGSDFGFDFNPTNDRIRLTSDGDINFLINPNDGVVTIQGALNPGNPNVVGSAYSNNFNTATTTTLFAIDSGTDQLLTQVPATGVLTPVGNLGFDTNGVVGFDIAGNGTAFASMNVGGLVGIFTINLSTGAAQNLGPAAAAFRDISVMRFVWDGGSSTDSNWTTAANWVRDRAPEAGDDLVFPAGAARKTNTNDFPDNTVFNSIAILDGGYTIRETSSGANTIQLGNGAVINAAANGPAIFDPGLTLVNPQTLANTGSEVFRIDGPIDLNGSALTVNTANANVNIVGNITGGGGITKLGPNILFFQGPNNDYAGQTLINAGTLDILDNSALGLTGAANSTIITEGAQLRHTIGANTIFDPETIQIAGDGPIDNGAILDTAGATFTGPIVLDNEATINVTNAQFPVIITGPIVDLNFTFELNKVGPGTLRYSGTAANTYTAFTNVAQGILQLDKTGGATAIAGLLNIDASVQYLQDDQVADSQTIVVQGLGTLDLNDRNDAVNDFQSQGVVLLGVGAITTNTRLLLNGNNSILSLRLDSPTSFGRAVVTNGSVTLDGIIQIDNTFSPAGGTNFILIDNDGTDPVSGSFTNFAEGTLQNFGGTTFTITYQGGDGNDVVLTAVAPSEISGTVFTDVNGNGVNNNDPGIDGITVNLDIGGDGSIDQTTTTTGGGLYAFAGLTAGTFRVTIVVPAGSIQTTNDPAAITLAPNQSATGVDFGTFELFDVSGVKFDDLNGNGTRDGGEPGISGVTINLDIDANGTIDATATTNANGNYSFNDLGPGTYRVTENALAGTVQTTANPPDFVAVSGTNVSADFGNFRLVSVSGLKFDDGNGDGVQNNGELGVGGVVIRLTNIGTNQTVETTTLANGSFTFANVGPGTFQIREVAPAGTVQTTPNPANFATVSGANVAGIVFGNQAGATELFATGADAGGGPHVLVYNADGSLRFSFFAYDGAFTGGVRVATGDVNGDGFDDIVTGAGAGGGSHVLVFDGQDLSLLHSFFAYPGFFGGLFVGAGDVNGDGLADVITGAGAGGGPHVKAFSGATGEEIRSFFAYDGAFTGGVRVAGGDVNGDGRDDIVTAAGPGGGPHVKAFSGLDSTELLSFFAFDANFTGGVFVAAGDIDGDGRDDIIAGAGAGHGPEVRIFSGQNASLLTNFFCYDIGFRGGVRVAAGDLDGDGVDDVITGAGPGGGPHVKVINPLTLDEVESFLAYDGAFQGGVFVG